MTETKLNEYLKATVPRETKMMLYKKKTVGVTGD